MTQVEPGFIEEYNQLRAEIRMYLEHGSKSLQIVMALAAASVTFGRSYPPLLLISSLITAFLWFDEIRHLRAVQRTAAYLEVWLEPHVPGLKWETINRHHKFNPSFFNRAIANAPFPVLFVVQAVYGFVLAKWPWGLGLAAIALVTGALAIASIRTSRYGRAQERDRWQKIIGSLTPTDLAASPDVLRLHPSDATTVSSAKPVGAPPQEPTIPR
jgi:hypothetical protein